MTTSTTARIAILAALALTACATGQHSSRTTTTAAEVSLPDPDPRPCPADLAPRVDFEPGVPAPSPAELAGIDRWARCLRQPEMQHMSVVLVEPSVDPVKLTSERAFRIRNELAARGVLPSRIVDAGREDGGVSDVVRLEVTSSATLPSLQADAQARREMR